MIEVKGLTKYYGSRAAVEDLNFHAEQGEIVGFLGINGAGKTTTMRILSGYMPPSSGTASVAGYDVIDQSLEVRKRVGYLPETVPLYEDLSVFEYLKFMASIRRVPDVEERVDDVIDMVQLGERSESFISSLSKGMRQRVGLAQALVHDPEVLVLDEPTIGLDPAQIIEVRNLIREIGKQHTVLLSTHILSEVQQMCNRVMIIHRGKIVAEDTPQRLQELLVGVQRYSLQVAGDDDGIVEVIKGVAGVQDAQMVESGHVEFQSLPGQESRPLVARRLVESGYDILELRTIGMSLEDIFLQLTREEPLPPEVDGDIDEDQFTAEGG